MQTTPSPLFISPNEMLSEEALLQSLNAPNYNAQATTTYDHHHSTSSSSNFVQSPIASLLQANPYLLAQQQQLFPSSQPRKRYAYTFHQILELRDHPVSRTMPPEIANLEIAITFASVPAHGYPPRERRDKFGTSSMSAPSSSSPTNGPLSSLSSHSSRSRGNSGATARGSLLSSPDGTSIRRSGGSERLPSKKSHFFNQSKDYDSSNSASMSASAASSLPGGIGRERTRKISSANSSSLPLDPLAPRSAPKQAAWFNEKVTKAGDSLEPNPEELTQSERDRRDAFEEFRKQHIKNRMEEEDAFGGQGGLPSFFSDSNAGGATSLTLEDEADSLESSNVQVGGALSRFSSLMNQDSNTGTKGSLTTGFMDLHLGSTDEDVIDDDVDSDSMMKPFSRRGGHEGSRGGSKFFNPSSAQNDRDQNNTSNRDASQSDTASIQPRLGGSRFINTSMSHGELSHPVLDEAQMMKDFVLSPTGFSPIPDMFMHGGVPPSRLPYPYPDMHRAGPTGSPHMDMMDASRLESELMGGNRPRDSAAHAANVDALHNVFAQMQQPQPPMVGGPAMPNRILTQHPPQQMGAQSMAPFMNGPAVVQQHNQQQFITPYQQYVQAQAMKKNQQPQQPPKQTTSTTTATKQSPQEEQKDTPTKSKAVKQTRSQFVPSQISKSIGKAIKPKKPTGNVTSSPSGSSTSSGTPPASTTASTSTSAPMTQGSSPPAISPTNQPPLNVQLPQHPQHMPNQPMFVQPQRGMMMPPHGMGKMSGPMPHLQAQQFGPMSPTFMMQQSPNFIPQQQMYNNPNMQQWFPAAFMGQGPMPTMMPMGSMSGEVMSLEDLEKNLTPVNK